MNKYRFAKRTSWALEENVITQTVKTLKDDGVSFLDLTVSNPTQCGFQFPQRKILKAFKNTKNLDYHPESHGLKEARQHVVDYFQERHISIDPQRIFLTASTSEGYSHFFRLMTNPGEEVLFPQPSYPLFSFLGDLHDVCLKFYSLDVHQDWAIDFESLESQIDEKTRAICLVNPNNPTGSYIQKQELERLQDICEKHQLVLICDEVFWEYNLTTQSYPSLLAQDKVPVCVLGGLSKTLAMPQMKFAWMILNGPEEWVQAATARLEVIADTFLSVSTPIQNAVGDWLKVGQAVQLDVMQRIQANYQFLQQEIEKQQTTQLLSSQGGWYAMLRVPAVRSEEEWVLKLLTKYHVLVHPGYFYDCVEEPYLVLSLLTPEETFQEGVLRILARVEQQCA